MFGVVDEMSDFGETAIDVAGLPTFYGGIAGIVVGSIVGGMVATKLTFSNSILDKVGAAGEFLIGAGLYGYGLTGRVANPVLRSMTQVSGVVVAGMGLGRLLSAFGAPTFGLGAEVVGHEDDGYVVGHNAEGYVVGQEDDGYVVGHAENYGNGGPMMEIPDPTSEAPSPDWVTGAMPVDDPFKTYSNLNSAKGHGVDEWFAEDVRHSPRSTPLGFNFNAEGMGNVVGQ
jgi:hypothetical protein